MDEKQLELLWKLNGKSGGFKDYAEFKDLISNNESRKVYFETSNKELGFQNYKDFEDTLGLGKQAEGSSKGLQNTSQNVKPTSSNAGLTDLSSITNSGATPTKPAPLTAQGRATYVAPKATVKPLDFDKINKDIKNKFYPSSKQDAEVKLQGKPKKEEGSLFTEPLKAGMYQASNMINKIPRFVYSAFAIPQNAIASLTGYDDLRANYDDVSKGKYNPLGIVDGMGDEAFIESKFHQDKITKFDKGVVESLSSGNFADAGKQIFTNFVQSAPSMAVMYLTAGVGSAAKLGTASQTAINALPFAAGAYDESVKDVSLDSVPDELKVVNAAINGYAEIFLEGKIGSKAIIDNIIKEIREEGTEIAIKNAKKVMVSFLEESIKKVKPLTSAVKNGIEEGATTALQNLGKRLTVNPNQDLYENVLESIAMGTGTGLGLSSVGVLAISSKNKEKLSDANKKREQIINDLDNENLPQDIAVDLKNQLGEVNNSITEIISETDNKTNEIPDTDKERIVSYQNSIEDLESSLSDESISESTKESIKDKVVEYQAQLDIIEAELDTATPQQSVSTDVVQDTPIVDEANPVSEVATPALKDVESAPQVEIPKNIIEAFKGGEKGITAGKQKALENFRKAGGKATSGLNVEQAAYALEYAILSIADGTIKTAKSLAKALGVKQEEVESIYNDATTKLTAYRKAEVNKSGDTIKQTIKKNTSGGTVGKTTKTVRQAIKDFYTTYNKGIREGVKQGRGEGGAKLKDFKENITNRKALSRGLRNDIRQLLINAKKSGKIGGTVSGFRSTNLAKVIANAETPQQLVRALDYTEKYINDAEYDTKVKQGKSLQTKIKGLASRKGVPVNLKETLKQISKIDLVKLEDIDKTNSILDKVSKILVNPLLTEDLYTEVDFVKQAIQIVEDYNKKKSEEITNELQLGGVDAQTLETLSIKDKQQMLLEMYSETSLNEDGLETENPPKEKATEQYRRVAKTLQNLIEDYVDTEGLTDIQKRDIEDIKNIDIDGVADKDLARLVFGLTNLVNTNSTVGIGDIVVTGKVATQAANTTLVNSVKDNIRKVVENVYAKYFRTGSNRLAFFVKNEKFIGRVNNLMGLTAFKLGSIDYNNAKAEIIKKMTELRKKHKEAFRNPVKSMLLSIYSDASQFKDSMSVEEKLTEYENRLVSWGKSLDKMKKEAVLSLSYNKENKNFIATAEESFNQVATLQFDEDGKISGVELKLTQEQLFKELGEAHQEFYKIMRDSYDQHKEDYFRVSEYYGNKELDKDIQNYIFRGYKTIDSPQADLVNSTKNNLDVVKKLASGSSEGRTNWGANLPSNRVLDFDIMGRFESDISAMLYDINTLEHRLYISKATNLKSSPIVEALGEGNKDVAKTYHEIVEMAVEQDRLQFGGNSLNKSAFLRLIGAVNKTGVAIALGGVGQYIKQTTPLIDTSVRLRNPINVLKAITIMFDKPEGFDAVFKYANVSTRDIVKDNTPINVNTKGYKSTNSAIINALRNLGVRAEDITEFTTNISLLPLQQTDKGIAGTSWVAFYIDYLQDAGKEVSFEKLDTEALDYADLMSSNVNNESDPRFKSKVSKNKYFQTFLPFMNFAINSKMDLINNLSKLNTAGAEKGRIIQNISGNISGILAYNTVALGFRSAVIGSTYGLAKAAIQAYTDDDDEREKLAEVLETYQEEKSDTNFVNYTKYVVKDLLFANIGAQSLDLMVDPLTDAIVDVPIRLYDKVTGDNVYGRNEAKTTFKYQPNDYEKLVANFGVAAPFFTRLADAYKYIKENNETDDSFIEQRKGKINAEGTDLIVDDYYKTEKGKQEFGKSILSERIDLFSMLASITSLSGGSLQEISAFKRGLNSIDRLFVEELRGKVKIKDKEKALKDYLDFSAIEVNGKEVLLSKEAQDEIATNFTKNVKQQKLEKPFGSYKNSMVKSDYETFIGNVSKGLAKQKYIQDNITNFTEPVKPKNVNKKITERNNLIKYQK